MLASVLTRRFAYNYFSTLLFIGVSYWIVTGLSRFHKNMLHAQWNLSMFGINQTITIHGLFIALIIFYAVILIPYYTKYPWLHAKAFVFLRGLWMGLARGEKKVISKRKTRRLFGAPDAMPEQSWLSPMTKQAGLTLLLKFFFAPLMINWCLAHIADMCNAVLQVYGGLQDGRSGRTLFDSGLFWACFQLILFVDTLLFTLGYILESPGLNNRIRTVEPTFFGWFICLACYPPFNDFTSYFFTWQSNDFPRFQNTALHVAANITILIAMAIYSWASIALGFKASNLTNRGIVGHGPYAYVRHPAYATKNFAWWLGAMPTIAIAFNNGLQPGAYSLFALCGWTFIYAMRALTEERHLLIANNGYAEYMQRVKYRFIPGII